MPIDKQLNIIEKVRKKHKMEIEERKPLENILSRGFRHVWSGL